MANLLILGASALQHPAILAAHALGHRVGVVDYDPEAPGIADADRFYEVSTRDDEGVLACAKDWKADGIFTMATDLPVRAQAYACAALGLPGVTPACAMDCTDKIRMIGRLRDAGVPAPWSHAVTDSVSWEEIKPWLRYPCIVKPADNSGSRGVLIVRDAEAIDEAYAYSLGFSGSDRVIIQEYMEGPEVSVEMMMVDGTPHILQITDKITTGPPHFVELGHSQPSRHPDAVRQAIGQVAVAAIHALGITTGAAHAEIIVTKEGPKIVEVGARMGGDYIASHLVPLSTGIDYVRAGIEVALGETPVLSPKFQRGAAIRYVTAGPGIVEEIRGDEAARKMPGVKLLALQAKPGDRLAGIHNSTERPGFVIATGDTAEQAMDRARRAAACVSFRMAVGDDAEAAFTT